MSFRGAGTAREPCGPSRNDISINFLTPREAEDQIHQILSFRIKESGLGVLAIDYRG
jgi:hypothetical protein